MTALAPQNQVGSCSPPASLSKPPSLSSTAGTNEDTSTLHVALDISQPQPAVKTGVSWKQPSQKPSTSSHLLRSVPAHKRIVLEFTDVNAIVPLLFGPKPEADPHEEEGEEADAHDHQDAAADTAGPVDEEQAQKPNLLRQLTNASIGGKLHHKPKERQVLFNITGCVQPGEVLALMGPSGSGKSSLLTVLAGRSTAKSTGSILFSGKPLNKAIKRKMGYVSQDDLLFAELTVYETLFYAAMLRLPRTWDKEAKLARVDLVIEALGLAKCKDTIIGNYMMRGVSGGERKRVSIGHELLINPSIIMLDEPTSGLDSTTALKLMHTLRMLATGGRTIVTSIHQPSSRLYQQMDKLMLLAEGRTMFYGDAHVAAHWFDKMGQPVPFGVSIADHLLDLACGDLPKVEAAEGRHIQQHLISAYEHRTFGTGRQGVVAEDLGKDAIASVRANTAGRKAAVASFSRLSGTSAAPQGAAPEVAVVVDGGRPGDVGHSAMGTSDKVQVESVPETSGGVVEDPEGTEPEEQDDGKWGASWVDQVRYLTSRSVRTRRFTSLSIQRVLEVLIVSVLAGLFWFQIGQKDDLDSQAVFDIGGLVFFMVLFMSFSSMFQAIFTFPLEFNMMVKERQSGMYRLTAYYVARTAADLPMDCLLPSIFCWILYFMTGLRLDAGAFFAYWWGMLLTMLTAQSVGLLIGASFTNPKNGLATATIFMLVVMLVGGFYVRGIPVWISWLKYLSFIYYGWNLLLKVQFGGVAMDRSGCAPDWPADQVCTVGDAGVFNDNPDDSPAKDACVQIAMLIFVRMWVYYALQRKTSFKK